MFGLLAFFSSRPFKVAMVKTSKSLLETKLTWVYVAIGDTNDLFLFLKASILASKMTQYLKIDTKLSTSHHQKISWTLFRVITRVILWSILETNVIQVCAGLALSSICWWNDSIKLLYTSSIFTLSHSSWVKSLHVNLCNTWPFAVMIFAFMTRPKSMESPR